MSSKIRRRWFSQALSDHRVGVMAYLENIASAQPLIQDRSPSLAPSAQLSRRSMWGHATSLRLREALFLMTSIQSHLYYYFPCSRHRSWQAWGKGSEAKALLKLILSQRFSWISLQYTWTKSHGFYTAHVRHIAIHLIELQHSPPVPHRNHLGESLSLTCHSRLFAASLLHLSLIWCMRFAQRTTWKRLYSPPAEAAVGPANILGLGQKLLLFVFSIKKEKKMLPLC